MRAATDEARLVDKPTSHHVHQREDGHAFHAGDVLQHQWEILKLIGKGDPIHPTLLRFAH
jgi:hypothetical protein